MWFATFILGQGIGILTIASTGDEFIAGAILAATGCTIAAVEFYKQQRLKSLSSTKRRF